MKSNFYLVTIMATMLTASMPAYASDKVGAYEIIPHVVYTDLETSKVMMEKQEHVTDKAIVQLRAIQDGSLQPYRLYVGGRFSGSYIAERTNTNGKFPILSRLPPTHTSGNSDAYGIVNDVTINATAVFPWVTGFVQGEYTEIAYRGQERNQIRKAWVTIGDLNKYPVYLTFGKKTVNFGSFESYAPFTHTHSAHYFWAQTDEPLFELGYVGDHGTMLAASLIRNDRGLRVLNTPNNDNKFENFSVYATQDFSFGTEKQHKMKLGVGFLRGSIYDSALAHHPPGFGLNDRFWNHLVNVNATANIGKWDLMAEYTQTLDDWPATGDKVRALTLQTRYSDFLFERPVKYTLAYSRGEQGGDRDEWHKMQQAIAGIEWEIFRHVNIGAEYMINDGFVPLILPRITADDGVVSHTLITGVKVAF